MQHLATNCLRQTIFATIKHAKVARPAAVIQLMPQRRWLAQRMTNATTATGNYKILEHKGLGGGEDKKVTPLGWFLLLIPITTFGLGCWQVKRKAWKEQLIKELEQQMKMEPVPMPENLDDLAKMEYRLVTVRGRFAHDKEMFLGPRSLIRPDEGERAGGLFSQRDGGNGYLVITPFQISDTGDVILINRGWVSRKQMHANARMEGQYDKELQLTGVVRSGEKRPQFTPDHKGEVFLYRDLNRMCAVSGAQPIILDATYESTIPGGPIGGQTRVTLRNDHLSYLITWYSLSAATAFMWYRQILKRVPVF